MFRLHTAVICTPYVLQNIKIKFYCCSRTYGNKICSRYLAFT